MIIHVHVFEMVCAELDLILSSSQYVRLCGHKAMDDIGFLLENHNFFGCCM